MSHPVLSQAWALHGFCTSHGPRTYHFPCPCHALRRPLKRHSDSSLCLRSAQICSLCGEIGLLNTEIRTICPSVTDLAYFGNSINTPLFPISGTVIQWSFPSRTLSPLCLGPSSYGTRHLAESSHSSECLLDQSRLGQVSLPCKSLERNNVLWMRRR